MSPQEERFMAFEGLVQWASAVVKQGTRVTDAKLPTGKETPEERRIMIHARHSEADFFVTAAWRLLAYRKWAKALALCQTVDFNEIDKFATGDTRDLRNMREHVVDYFQGVGNDQDRWMIETPEYKAPPRWWAQRLAAVSIGKHFPKRFRGCSPNFLKSRCQNEYCRLRAAYRCGATWRDVWGAWRSASQRVTVLRPTVAG
jgi:hypothetical protein